jgi:hypothetical protein
MVQGSAKRLGILFVSSVAFYIFADAGQSQSLVQSPLSLQRSAPPAIADDRPSPSPSQAIAFSPENQTQFHKIMQWASRQDLAQQPFSVIMQTVAEHFLGAPYAANLLDQTSDEILVVTLDQFDCVLFVETVLALARSIATADTTPQTFVHHLQEQRYTSGEMNGYCSRLHYFSDWIMDNQQRQIVTDLAPSLGGMALDKPLNFMSRHRQSYPGLANSETDYQCILQMETRLNAREIEYIPTEQIGHHYSQLQSGDIVAIATDISGLDVTHTGLVYRSPTGNIGLIHAAPDRGVIIARDLQTYVAHVEDAIGILIARPVDPRDHRSANSQR